MLFSILVPVVQVLMPPVRGDWFARASNAAGFMTPAARVWNFGARRAGRRKYRRGGRFKNGGRRSRRSCLMGTHPEKKFKDTTFATAPSTAGAISSPLSTIAQGVEEFERVGRKAIITDILVKGHLACAAVAGGTGGSNRIRIDLVQDMQPNKAVFAVTDYLETADINSYKNLAQAKRFKTLYSHVWTINAKAGGGDGTTNWISGTFIPVNINVKCCIDMEYSLATGAIGAQTINSLHLVLWEEATTPATSSVLNSRIRFVE